MRQALRRQRVRDRAHRVPVPHRRAHAARGLPRAVRGGRRRRRLDGDGRLQRRHATASTRRHGAPPAAHRGPQGRVGLRRRRGQRLARHQDRGRAGARRARPADARARRPLGRRPARRGARGHVPESVIDDKVARIVRLAERVGALSGPAGRTCRSTRAAPPRTGGRRGRRAPGRGGGPLDGRAPQRGRALPVATGPDGTRRIALIGHNAVEPFTQGGGSAFVTPPHVSDPLEALRAAFPEAEVALHRGGARPSARRSPPARSSRRPTGARHPRRGPRRRGRRARVRAAPDPRASGSRCATTPWPPCACSPTSSSRRPATTRWSSAPSARTASRSTANCARHPTATSAPRSCSTPATATRPASRRVIEVAAPRASGRRRGPGRRRRVLRTVRPAALPVPRARPRSRRSSTAPSRRPRRPTSPSWSSAPTRRSSPRAGTARASPCPARRTSWCAGCSRPTRAPSSS